jgi:uncharacterized RDD family membrane protein YckC
MNSSFNDLNGPAVLQNDPYAPPSASLGGPTPLEQQRRESGELTYSTFWQRVAAMMLDFLIVSPLIAVNYLLEGKWRLYQLYALGPTELLSFFLFVYMVAKYGGSPGKLIVGLRIVQQDGSAAGWKAALLRYGPLWILNLAIVLPGIFAALGMTDEVFLSMDADERAEALGEQMPMTLTLTFVMFGWFVASLVTILANAKRRTLHDFIAGTVVVRK